MLRLGYPASVVHQRQFFQWQVCACVLVLSWCASPHYLQNSMRTAGYGDHERTAGAMSDQRKGVRLQILYAQYRDAEL